MASPCFSVQKNAERLEDMQHVWQQEKPPLSSWVDLRTIGNEPVTAISAALQFQHRFFLTAMDGVLCHFPCMLKGNAVILDLLCGPGNWGIDISRKYPEAQVWGIDSNQNMIELAQENAVYHSSGNLHFRLGDYAQALPFANETFDLIHLQNGTSFFSLHQWPLLMTEVVRLLKPGGWLQLIDFEMGVVSHPAIHRLLALRGQLLTALNRSTGLSGQWKLTSSTLGLHRMSQYAFTNAGYHLYPLNLGGWHNQIGRKYLTWCLARPENMLSLVELAGISTAEDWQLLVRQAQWEVQQLDFCGVGMLLAAFGQKSMRYSAS